MEATSVDVLLVEDEQDSRQALADLLREEGYTVTGARNGEAALAMLRDGTRPKLIILDLNMPIMNGWGFFREIDQSQELSAIPVAIISGAGLPQSIPTRRQDAGFFKKPIDLPRLVKTVKAHCGGRPRKA